MGATVLTILRKDLAIELKTKEAVSAAFVFGVLALVIFNFALDVNTAEGRRLGAGFFWVAFAFAGVLSLNRSFAIEKADGCARALLLAPVDTGALYLGKLLGNLIFMMTTQLLMLPLFAMFFDVDVVTGLPRLLAIFVLGSFGFSSVGTLFSAVAANTRMRELLLPVLLLPIAIPVLIAAVETTAHALGVADEPAFWYRVLVVYDVVFVTTGFLGFGYVLED